MSKRFLMASAALVSAVALASATAVAAETTQEEEATACSMYTGCPNSSTQLCAIIHLTIMGAGVDYYCYQPIQN